MYLGSEFTSYNIVTAKEEIKSSLESSITILPVLSIEGPDEADKDIAITKERTLFLHMI